MSRRDRVRAAWRRLLRADVLPALGLVLLGVAMTCVAVLLVGGQKDADRAAAASAVQARVGQVLAERDWAALKLDLPGGSHTVIPIEPGQEFNDVVTVHRPDGDGAWVLGTPESGYPLALALGLLLTGLGVPIAASGARWLLEEHVLYELRNR